MLTHIISILACYWGDIDSIFVVLKKNNLLIQCLIAQLGHY